MRGHHENPSGIEISNRFAPLRVGTHGSAFPNARADAILWFAHLETGRLMSPIPAWILTLASLGAGLAWWLVEWSTLALYDQSPMWVILPTLLLLSAIWLVLRGGAGLVLLALVIMEAWVIQNHVRAAFRLDTTTLLDDTLPTLLLYWIPAALLFVLAGWARGQASASRQRQSRRAP
ncbi:hypothetical protein ATO8_06471 [Roseivivax marinus]|uniref:Uncharacterized protein n=2 Tax=Roseivivax marinus TaxID=1379903 RepID=W4HMK0_9RHOB|nr:hypothetical protein ATO8_06471 [Roseivivax marinus]